MPKVHPRPRRKTTLSTRNRRILVGVFTVWGLATIISTRGHFDQIPSAALDIFFTWGFAIACVGLLLMGLASLFSMVPLKIFGLSDDEGEVADPPRRKPSHLKLVETPPARDPKSLQ